MKTKNTLVMLFLPVVIYVPVSAFHQDLSIYTTTIIVAAICIFYTSTGGLRAVIWTDTIQNMFTILAVLFVICAGYVHLGGIREIWRINEQGGRLELFNLDLDPFARGTLWTYSIGYFFIYLAGYAAIPSSVQKYLAVPSLSHARWVLFYTAVSYYIYTNLIIFFGMILYARYHQCDPVASGVIKNYNEMVPLFVAEVGKNYPGLTGLFISGVLSASLSTMSSWLNAIGGILYKDVMDVYFPFVRHAEATQFKMIRATVIVMGCVSTSLVFVVERLGSIFQLSVTITSVAFGSMLSLFTLGIFFPCVNVKRAATGILSSFILTFWIISHAQCYILTGRMKYPGKFTSIANCSNSIEHHYNASTSLLFNYTGVGSPVVADSSVPQVYQLSYNYYIVVSTLSGIVVGLIVSLLTEPPKVSSLNPNLFTPCVHRFLPKKEHEIRLHEGESMLIKNEDNLTKKSKIIV